MKENSNEETLDIRTDIFSILDSTVHLPETLKLVVPLTEIYACNTCVCICAHTLNIASVQLFVFVLNKNISCTDNLENTAHIFFTSQSMHYIIWVKTHR
jgi:hypothetical protein